MQIMVSNHGVFDFVSVTVTGAGAESEYATVHVPFDFMVGDKVLRAGTYAVEPSDTPGRLRFRSQDRDDDAILVQAINSNRMEAVIPQKLVFLVQQNTYYLGQALMASV